MHKDSTEDRRREITSSLRKDHIQGIISAKRQRFLANSDNIKPTIENITSSEYLKRFSQLKEDFDKQSPESYSQILKNVMVLVEGDRVTIPVQQFLEAGLLKYV